MFYSKSLLLLLRWDTGKVRDRFGGMGRGQVERQWSTNYKQINYSCNNNGGIFEIKAQCIRVLV